MVNTQKNAMKRRKFDDLTPIYPTEKISIRNKTSNDYTMRLMDLLSPIGKRAKRNDSCTS